MRHNRRKTTASTRPSELSSDQANSTGKRREIEYVALGDLKPSPHNVRTHPKKQIRQIAASIRRFGFQPPIIINGEGTILAGHGRVLAAEELGISEVPCVRVKELSAAEQRAYALAENQIARNAGTDREALFFELMDLSQLLPELAVPLDLDITGFSVAEIDGLRDDFEEPSEAGDDDDVEPPAEGPAVSRKDDLWTLGSHRLLCGDARDKDAYHKLLDGKSAEIVIADPPFNVPVNGHVAGRGQVKHAEFAFASGEMSGQQYHRFLTESTDGMAGACVPGALIYLFCDWRSVQLFCQVGSELGLRLINICVWNKTTPGQGSLYRSAHELICVFAKPGAAHRNNIELGRHGRSRTNVWTYAAPNRFAGKDDAIRHHPTPKPVPMIGEAIKDASARGGIVLDAFLGSGTTILAAEKVGRAGYGIEFEPRFCDLSIRRWQTVTGRDAVLKATGQTFEEVALARRVTAVAPPAQAASWRQRPRH